MAQPLPPAPVDNAPPPTDPSTKAKTQAYIHTNTWAAMKLWFKQIQTVLKGITNDGSGNVVFTGTINGAPAGILLGAPRLFFTPGTFTYTPTSSLVTAVILEIQGAGGSSAGSATTGAGQVSAGGPGGPGGYLKHYLTTGFSGATVVVGAPGAAPAAGVNGNAGGASSFAGVTAGGGGGGTAGTAGSQSFGGGGSGGTGTGANIINSAGAPSPLSFGLQNEAMIVTGFSSRNCLGFIGSGGNGTVLGSSSAGIPGLVGNPGLVIVWEYV